MRTSIIVLALTLMACSDKGRDSPGAGTGGAGAAGSGGVLGGGGTGGVSGSGGTMGSGGANGGSTGSLSAPSLFPLAVGNTWSYELSDTSLDFFCEAGDSEYLGVLPRTDTFEGREAYVLVWLCDEDAEDYLTQVGNEIQQFVGGEWITTLADPVEDGHQWSASTVSFEWRDVGSVTVPAGTFDNCWDRVPSGATGSYNTYCAGVGPVRITSTGNFILELLWYELH